MPPHVHTWDAGEETQAATCTVAGVWTYHCTADPAHTKTEAIPALGHDFSAEWSQDAVNHWHDCIRGDAVQDEEAHAWGAWGDRPDVTGHVRGCDLCGWEETSLHVWEYIDNADGATHTKFCAVGGERASFDHVYDQPGDVCVCGASKPAPPDPAAPSPSAEFSYEGSGVNFSVRWVPKTDTVIDPAKEVKALINITYETDPEVKKTPILITLEEGADGVWTKKSQGGLSTSLSDGATYSAEFVSVFQGSVADVIESVGKSADFVYQSV